MASPHFICHVCMLSLLYTIKKGCVSGTGFNMAIEALTSQGFQFLIFQCLLTTDRGIFEQEVSKDGQA